MREANPTNMTTRIVHHYVANTNDGAALALYDRASARGEGGHPGRLELHDALHASDPKTLQRGLRLLLGLCARLAGVVQDVGIAVEGREG